MTSSHATQFNLEMPFGLGLIASHGGKFHVLTMQQRNEFAKFLGGAMFTGNVTDLGKWIDSTKAPTLTDSNDPKVWVASGNCLIGDAKAVMEAMKARGAEVPIPTDVVTAKSFSADAVATVKAATDVADDDLILDIGPETAKRLAAQLMQAGTIVWNGPVGVFEFAAFENGTKVIAQAIAASSAFSIAGGGDTLAAIAKYGIEKEVGYISTGGGAFLEVLEGKTLPAFEILQNRAAG